MEPKIIFPRSVHPHTRGEHAGEFHFPLDIRFSDYFETEFLAQLDSQTGVWEP